jgi:dihydrofolate reductase
MLRLIVAVANDNVIGKDNKLLCHIPEDLKRFKQLTTGNAIVMGRKTFESLPNVLPNRWHVVLTRDESYRVNDDRVTIVNDIKDIIELKDTEHEYFIIGGGEIYKTFLPYCKKLYITKIDEDFEGDTYFPDVDFDNYDAETVGNYTHNGLEYSFINLVLKD